MAIKHAINVIRHVVHQTSSKRKRNPKWDSARDDYLKSHSICAACGSTTKLNVHHKKPFHLYPELELDPANFITLCMSNDCHLLIGHGDDFKAYNPDVTPDAAIVANDKENLPAVLKEVSLQAKQKRVYE